MVQVIKFWNTVLCVRCWFSIIGKNFWIKTTKTCVLLWYLTKDRKIWAEKKTLEFVFATLVLTAKCLGLGIFPKTVDNTNINSINVFLKHKFYFLFKAFRMFCKSLKRVVKVLRNFLHNLFDFQFEMLIISFTKLFHITFTQEKWGEGSEVGKGLE